MSVTKIDYIEQALLDIKEPPVDLSPIAEGLNLEVYSAKGWEDDISGMIRKDRRSKENGYTIYSNAAHPLTRRRFTIAHEIAHYILHEDLIGGGITDGGALYRSKLSSAIESEANRLAAGILMPRHLVMSALEEENSLEGLSSLFNVSPQAMAIRLSRLNIIID